MDQKKHSEENLPEVIAQGIELSCHQSAAIIGMSVTDDPAAIMERLDEYIYGWQGNQRPDPKVLDPQNAPFALGSLWGTQLVRKFGWEWKIVTFHELNNAKVPGVLSPRRSYGIYPIHFLMGCLDNPDIDCTLMLCFNMLASGSIRDDKPNTYLNLMAGVQRVTPRENPVEFFKKYEDKKQSWKDKFNG